MHGLIIRTIRYYAVYMYYTPGICFSVLYLIHACRTYYLLLDSIPPGAREIHTSDHLELTRTQYTDERIAFLTN